MRPVRKPSWRHATWAVAACNHTILYIVYMMCVPQGLREHAYPCNLKRRPLQIFKRFLSSM